MIEVVEEVRLALVQPDGALGTEAANRLLLDRAGPERAAQPGVALAVEIVARARPKAVVGTQALHPNRDGAPGVLSTWVLDFGPRGLWFGLTAGLTASGVALTARFSRVARTVRPVTLGAGPPAR